MAQPRMRLGFNNLVRAIFGQPIHIPADVIKQSQKDIEQPTTKKAITPQQIRTMAASMKSGGMNNFLYKVISAHTRVNYARLTFYKECFTGDTKVALVDGRDVDFKTLVEEYKAGKINYVYSINNNNKRIERCKISYAGKTGKREIMKVTLDNNLEIKCTPDHLFMKRDGSYCQAQELEPGTSLMPLYRDTEDKFRNGYWRLYDPFSGKYRVQYLYFNPDRPKFNVVHHKNFNKLDDTPTNHQIMTQHDHTLLHGQLAKELLNSEDVAKKRAIGIKRYFSGLAKEQITEMVKPLNTKESWKKKVKSLKLNWEKMSDRERIAFGKKISKGLAKLKTNNPEAYQRMMDGLKKSQFKKGNTPWDKGITKETSAFAMASSERLKKNNPMRDNPEIRRKNGITQLVNRRSISREEAGKIYDEKHGKILNHKVKSVEFLNIVEDVYDIEVGPYHNFALSNGVFVHNCEQSLEHSIISGSMEVYADVCTTYNNVANATVWVTSEDSHYVNVLTKFLDDIGVEQRIWDWCFQTGEYGDFFVKPHGMAGAGIAYVEDDIHPGDVERIDINGKLEGFVRTNLVTSARKAQAGQVELAPPWEYVHFRIMGSRKRRHVSSMGMFGDVERQYQLLQTEEKGMRVTTRYGSSILSAALPIYKRLKLMEDSLLLSRIARTPLWYLVKINVGDDADNFDATMELVREYERLFKRSEGLDLSDDSKFWQSQYNPMNMVEDIFIPTFGNEGVTVEEKGGKPDVKAIVDVELLERRLYAALRVPPAFLGDTDDLPGSLGQSALERLDIRFARSATRLQNAVRQGIKRLCQIHLAYMGLNPSADLFDVQMSETSSAEEEELKNALETGTDIVDKVIDVMSKAVEDVEGAELDKLELLNYLNGKILKMNDLQFGKVIKVLEDKKVIDKDKLTEEQVKAKEQEEKDKKENEMTQVFILDNTDLAPYTLPTGEKHGNNEAKWRERLEKGELPKIELKIVEKKKDDEEET